MTCGNDGTLYGGADSLDDCDEGAPVAKKQKSDSPKQIRVSGR